MNQILEIASIVLAIGLFIWLWWDFSPLKCLLIAIINTIYGALLLMTLSLDTPGLYLVLAISSVLIIMGLSGFVLWIRQLDSVNPVECIDNAALKSWFSLIRSLDIVLIIGLLFRTIILQPYIVEGSSMEPTFHDKEIMMVDKISYRFHEPFRGDIVIFHAPKNPEDDYIKRVIGLPGETITISQGKVYVNNQLVEEKYLTTGISTTTAKSVDAFRQTLGANEYFVLGDNRNNSSDSRDWGVLPKINIVGRAWYVLIPWNSNGLVKHNAPIILKEQLLQNIVNFNHLLSPFKS